MVFVIVVIACCAKAQSAILRLFFAMRMLRVHKVLPKPFKSGCEIEIESDEFTSGLKKLAMLELLRVLFQFTVRLVPV